MKKQDYKTCSRQAILGFLQDNMERTVTVEDISIYLEQQKIDTNLSTVYRYLDQLVKKHLLIKYVATKGNKAAYQLVEEGHNCESHLHLKCTECGGITHFECGFMEEVAKHIEDKHGFALQCKDSVLYGVCKECQKKQNSED